MIRKETLTDRERERERELGIFSMIGFDSATSTFLFLLVKRQNLKAKGNRKNQGKI